MFRTIVALLFLWLATGCAQIKGIFTPTPAPPPPPARPSRPTPPPTPAREEPPILRLSPQVSSEREIQLTEEVNTIIQKVEQILASINRQRLQSDQWETHQTIQSFLSQARKSVADKDFQQAMNLAQKADVLSHELSRAVH